MTGSEVGTSTIGEWSSALTPNDGTIAAAPRTPMAASMVVMRRLEDIGAIVTCRLRGCGLDVSFVRRVHAIGDLITEESDFKLESCAAAKRRMAQPGSARVETTDEKLALRI